MLTQTVSHPKGGNNPRSPSKTTVVGIPTMETLETLRSDLRHNQNIYANTSVVPPLPKSNGTTVCMGGGGGGRLNASAANASSSSSNGVSPATTNQTRSTTTAAAADSSSREHDLLHAAQISPIARSISNAAAATAASRSSNNNYYNRTQQQQQHSHGGDVSRTMSTATTTQRPPHNSMFHQQQHQNGGLNITNGMGGRKLNSTSLVPANVSRFMLMSKEVGVREMITSLALLCLVSLLLALLSLVFLLKISPVSSSGGKRGDEKDEEDDDDEEKPKDDFLLSTEDYVIVHEVTLAMCALTLSLNLCCLLVCAIQFLFAVKLVKSAQGRGRTNKYLKEASLTRICAIAGFFISIPVFLTGIILYTFLHFDSTPAIITSVLIGMGIIFCGAAVVHNVFVWQREKIKAMSGKLHGTQILEKNAMSNASKSSTFGLPSSAILDLSGPDATIVLPNHGLELSTLV